MSDLISRSALLEKVRFRMNPESYDATVIDGFVKITRQTIENAPAVDAVEVVSCKDCKHWHKDTGWCYHHSHFVTPEGEACHPWESADWKMFDENDFCSYGERRNDQ